MGPRSAGHYVKTVHNGIEYAMMQALAEVYDLLHRGAGHPPEAIAEVLAGWSRGPLEGFLVELTERILRWRDAETGKPLVERILDTASQKGTGRWASQLALEIGSVAPTIAAAVFARNVSSLRDERLRAAETLDTPALSTVSIDLADLEAAALLAVTCAFAQGFRQLADASDDRRYDLDLSEIARVWTGGCIVRTRLLDPIRAVWLGTPDLPLLILAEPFRTMWSEHHAGLRRTVIRAHQAGIPVPAMSSALNLLDAYRTPRLPASLIQAQRDAFGAHGYQRIDRDGIEHTDWSERLSSGC